MSLQHVRQTFEEAETSLSSATSADEAEMMKTEPADPTSEQEIEVPTHGGGEGLEEGVRGGGAEEALTSTASDLRWPISPYLVADEESMKEVNKLLKRAIRQRRQVHRARGEECDPSMYISTKSSFATLDEPKNHVQEIPAQKSLGWKIWHFSSAAARNMALEELQEIIHAQQRNGEFIHMLVERDLFDDLGSNTEERVKEFLTEIEFADENLAASGARFVEESEVKEKTKLSFQCDHGWVRRATQKAYLSTVTFPNLVFYNQVKLV